MAISRLFIILGVIFTFHLASDYYIYQVVKSVYKDTVFINYFKWVLLFLSVITIAGVLGTLFSISAGIGVRSLSINLLLGISFAYLAAKIFLIAIFLFIEMIRLIEWIIQFFVQEKSINVSRRKFFVNAGLIIGSIPLFSLLYGMLINKYNYQVRKITLSFPDLPLAFDGYKIIQISDIHSGSFDDKNAVQKGVDLINAQNPDLVVFTGDLVNDHPDEIDPYINVFKMIKAKDGIKSTSGNHDYHYLNHNNGESYSRLVEKHIQLGYDMLNNEHRRIERGVDSIVIAGVENWGLPPFPQRGDINKAFNGLKKDDFTILLSHDPSHWDAQVLPHSHNVHLTLSGHTHGMQFGIDLPKYKWSPVKWKYPRWIDLYKQNEQYLYVNRGFGFIGYPGRVGVLPEITQFELKVST